MLALLAARSLAVFTCCRGCRARRATARAAQLEHRCTREFWEENLKLNPITRHVRRRSALQRRAAELPVAGIRGQSRAFDQKYLDRARAIGTDGPHRPGPALVRHLHAESRIGARGARVSRPAAAHRPVLQHRQLLRAARLRHERAAVRDREGLRRLAEARGADARRSSTRPS